jgi:hypothetical protein
MKDSKSLSSTEVDRIAEAVLKKIDGEPTKTDDDETGWYPGKYASTFIERVTEGATRGGASAIQDDLRLIGERFFERNAIYKTKLQKGSRVAVPEAEIETLGIEDGQTLQVTPVHRPRGFRGFEECSNALLKTRFGHYDG